MEELFLYANYAQTRIDKISSKRILGSAANISLDDVVYTPSQEQAMPLILRCSQTEFTTYQQTLGTK